MMYRINDSLLQTENKHSMITQSNFVESKAMGLLIKLPYMGTSTHVSTLGL